MKITGIVLETKGKTAFIYTDKGEFRKVKINSEVPSIGERYTGKSRGIHLIKGQVHPFRNLFFIILITLLFSSLCFAYTYFSPTSTILIDNGYNSSFQLKCNRWDKIIKTSSVDDKINIILKKVNLKNYDANEALIIIIKECKTKHYIKEDKATLLYVNGQDLNLSQLKKFADDNSIKLIINSNGEN